MYQVTTSTDGVPAVPFPIPGHTGDIKVQVLNADQLVAPFTAVMTMAPGSRIPAHVHHKARESFVVLDGTFIDDGREYGPGSFFACTPGTKHGPHETATGCRVLFFQSDQVDPSDFEIAE